MEELERMLKDGKNAIGRDKAKAHHRIWLSLNIRFSHDAESDRVRILGGQINQAIVATMRDEIPLWIGVLLITELAVEYHGERIRYAGAAIRTKATPKEAEDGYGD